MKEKIFLFGQRFIFTDQIIYIRTEGGNGASYKIIFLVTGNISIEELFMSGIDHSTDEKNRNKRLEFILKKLNYYE